MESSSDGASIGVLLECYKDVVLFGVSAAALLFCAAETRLENPQNQFSSVSIQ